jgi:ketosteroid isomerase-like protein
MIPAVIKTLTTVVAGALLFTAAATAKSPPVNNDVKKLWDAEHTWVKALEEGKPALLETLIDNEFSFIGPDGEYEERQAYLAGYRALPAQGIKVEKVELNEVKMRVLGDTGVVTGRALARVKVQGQPVTDNVRFTRVYQRRGADWRMVAGQGTRLAPRPPQP